MSFPYIKIGPGWGDEVCDRCGLPADRIVHLAWPDDADEDYAQSCAIHQKDMVHELWTRFNNRRNIRL